MVKPRELGHVNIRVRDLDRAEKFYTEMLGLTVTHRRPGIVFMAVKPGHHSHEIAVMSMNPNAGEPDPLRVGINHFAWKMDTFEDLQAIYHHLKDNGVDVSRARENSYGMGVYFNDPDGNGNEIYYEGDDAQWLQGIWEGKFDRSLDEKSVSR